MKKLRYTAETIKKLCIELNRKRENFKIAQWERKDIKKLLKDVGLPHDEGFVSEAIKNGIFVKEGTARNVMYRFCKEPIHYTVLEDVFNARRSKQKEAQNERKKKSEVKKKNQLLDSALKGVVKEDLLCSVLTERGYVVEGKSFYDENTLIRIAKVIGYKVAKVNKIYL